MSDIVFDTDLLSLLPEWYRKILDYQQICQSEEGQLEALAEAINGVADNFFFQTMDVSSVQQWEKIFRIIPNPSTESLEFRRSRLLNRMSTRPPYTLSFLYQKLDELIGRGQWTVNVDYPNYTIYIESSASNQAYASEVAVTMNTIKPAHMVYRNTPLVVSNILMSETIEMVRRVYNYRLGGWGLGVSPFASELSQGVIKMPTLSSITGELLDDAANAVSDDITYARINGNTLISSLNKSVSGSAVTVTYDVTEEHSSGYVRLVELLDSSQNTLTVFPVYVPVSQGTTFKHTINVAEGVTSNAQ